MPTLDFCARWASPSLSYGDALRVVRIILLTCVTLHITAAYQLTRMNWQAAGRLRNQEECRTSFAARTMRWGGGLLIIFIDFHIAHLTLGAVGFAPGQFKDLHVYQNVVPAFSIWPVAGSASLPPRR
jgi:succinate dehydrogenase / fumarate reductase cytochrome b subunit